MAEGDEETKPAEGEEEKKSEDEAQKEDTEKSNFHYRKAIKYDHPTGWAYEKLVINLTKQGKLEEAIDVCQQLIDHPNVPKPLSYLTKDDMKKRKKKLEAKLAAQK